MNLVPTELSQAAIIKDKIEQLHQALISDHPSMPILLKEIHKATLNDFDTVTVLTEDEIAILVVALVKQTGVSISAKPAKKAVGKITADDL